MPAEWQKARAATTTTTNHSLSAKHSTDPEAAGRGRRPARLWRCRAATLCAPRAGRTGTARSAPPRARGTAASASRPTPPSANSLATNPATAPMNQESSDMQIHYEFNGGGGDGGGSSFLPPSLDSDAIADTIKSFFPMAAAAAAGGGGGDSAGTADPSSSSPIGFQSYPPDLLSRTSSSGQNQDLRLSLQSFQDLHFHHQQHQQHHHHQQQQQNQWSDSAAAVPWAWAMAESSSGNAGGYVFGVQQQQQQQQAMAMQQQAAALGQSQFFTQRGPLQSSNQPFARAWADPMAAADQHHHHLMHSAAHHHSAAHSIGFASGGSSGFSGFRIPARIQGEEEHDGISDKPSSASSGSHH